MAGGGAAGARATCPAERSPAWVKLKRTEEATLTVGAWVEGVHGGLVALVVGEPSEAGLQHRGRVGLGLTANDQALLRELLPPLERSECPASAS